MERWWDTHAGAVHALDLVDGSSPSAGVGVSVLGFHGIAKSALEPLTKATLVDVAQMQAAIDDADYDPVIEAVHSAVCGAMEHAAAVEYAESVVDDWIEQSKTAVARVGSVLVNKGLSWPKAVSRIADVVGVPLTHLGRYTTVAMTPNLDDLSGSDYADRTLMQYAAYRADMESDLVSKSERHKHRAKKREFDESEVNRDELGRFAIEAASAEEHAERRRRRQARQKRRATQKQQKQAETPKVEQKPQEERKIKRVDTQRKKVHRRDFSPSSGVQRIDTNTGAFGLPLFEYGSSMPKDPEQVFTVNKRMYMVEDENGLIPVAITEVALFSVLDTLMKSGSKRLGVLSFEPGELPVMNAEKNKQKNPLLPAGLYVPADVLDISMDGTRPFVPSLVKEHENTVFHTEITSSSGQTVHVTYDYGWVDLADDDFEFEKSEGPYRYRERKREFDESDVVRDEQGRFAVQAQSAEDLAALRRHRMNRQKRREREQKRQEAQQAKEQTKEEKKEIHRFDAKQKITRREMVGEKKLTRQAADEKKINRVDTTPSLDLNNWVAPVGPFPFVGVRKDSRLIAWISPPNLHKSGDVEISDQIENTLDARYPKTYTPWGGMVPASRRDYSIISEDNRREYLMQIASEFSKVNYMSHQPSVDVLAMTAKQMADWGANFRENSRDFVGYSYIGPVDENDEGYGYRGLRQDAALQDNALVVDANGRAMMVTSPLRQSPDTSVVLISDRARIVFQDIKTMLSEAQSSDKRTLIEQAKNAWEKMYGPDTPATLSDLALLYLRLSDIQIGVMPAKFKRDFATEALAMHRDINDNRPVRLDGIDVYRIY